MKLADLPASVIEQIKTYRYDSILEKHEGPWKWSSVLEYYEPELLLIDAHYILLPVSGEDHPHLTVLRSILSADGKTLTLFLKDTTYVSDPQHEWIEAGRLAICEKVPHSEFYIATVYHEWFILDNEGLG